MLIKPLSLHLEEKKFLISLEDKFRSLKIPVISIDTGVFLEFAVLMRKPEKLLEIGCGTGFSTYFLVKNLRDLSSYTGIDLNKERLISAESFIKEKYKSVKTNFICGNALNIIPDLDEKFDFVFIDAAKFEYPGYLEAILKKLNKGAMVIADNIFFNNKIFSKTPLKHDIRSVNGIKEYLEIITSNKNVTSTQIINVGDGLAVSIYGDCPDDKQ